MRHLLLGALLLILALGVQAQTNLQLDSIIIQDSRIETAYQNQNRNIAILTQQEIASLPVHSVSELLAYVSGVDLRQRNVGGVQADISIDGSTFDEVLILVNGVKMSDPQTGHHVLSLPIPLSAIDHIEIIRGPAARTYGVNALAGAVNIVTRQPKQNGIYAEAYAGSSFQKDSLDGLRSAGGVNAAWALHGKSISQLLSVSHDAGNGFRYNTAYTTTKAFYSNRLQLDKKNSVELMGGYLNNDFGASLFYAAPNDLEANEHVQTTFASILHNLQVNPKLRLSPRISYRYNKDDYIYVRQKPELYHNIHETNALTAELQSSLQVKKGTIGAGIEYRMEEINSSNLGHWQRNNLGLYAEYAHAFSKSLNMTAGLYGNYNSDFGWKVYPGLDFGYRFAPRWRLFINASSGQRLPTYTDLYYQGPGNLGNASLQPEFAVGSAAGVQYTGAQFHAKASYFYRQTSEFIDWVKDSVGEKWQPQNFQSVDFHGATLSLQYELGQILHLPHSKDLQLGLSYTYLDAALDAPSGKISKYRIDALRHQLVSSLSASFLHHFQFQVNYRYQCRMNAGDYSLVDARLSYLIAKWTVYADGSNLLDTKYEEINSIPMPGRWMTIGVRMRL